MGERLSISGGNIAYGLDTPTNGPFPQSFTQIDDQVEIVYDQPFTYNNKETSGMKFNSFVLQKYSLFIGKNFLMLFNWHTGYLKRIEFELIQAFGSAARSLMTAMNQRNGAGMR